MSHWRIAARLLYDMGGSGTLHQLELKGGDRSGLNQLKTKGFVTGERYQGGKHFIFTLTQLGIDFCENRVELATAPGTGEYLPQGGRLKDSDYRIVATWLKALPRDISLGHGDALHIREAARARVRQEREVERTMPQAWAANREFPVQGRA